MRSSISPPYDANSASVSFAVLPKQQKIYWLLFGLIVCLEVVPFWTLQNLPLADYPQLLGRGYIAAHYTKVPLFQNLYEPPLSVITNRAYEALAQLFGHLVDLDILGRVFISAITILFALSCHLIARLYHGRAMWTTLPMLFFFYSVHLVYGNLNFLLGLSLFFLFFTAWRRVVEYNVGWASLLVLLSGVVLFVVHIAAYVLAWPAIGVSLIFSYRKRRISFLHGVTQLLSLLPAVFLFQIFFSHGGSIGSYAFDGPYIKLIKTLTLVSTYQRGFDIAFAIAFAAILIFAFVRSRLRFNPEAVTIGILFYILLLLCPGTVFAASGADVRFLIPAAVFVLASVDCAIDQSSLRVVLASILILFTVRISVIVFDWYRMSDWLQPQLAMLEEIPEGSRFYPLYFSDSVGSPLGKLFPQFGVYPLIKHHNEHPGLLTIRKENGKPSGGHYFQALQAIPKANSLDSLLHSYDYFWSYRLPAELKADLNGKTQIIATAGEAELCRSLLAAGR